jgi:pantoate--beta-alanine ligase
MNVFETLPAFQEWRNAIPPSQKIGFVPTMGALHAGHESLLKKARKENDVVILSIFVNPAQFNQAEDFAKYPKTFEQDLILAKNAGVDGVFAPSDPKAMYPDGYRYRITENEFSNELCGAHRPGHFDGVLSVVMKLFQLTKPHQAYFGEKDHQQLSLIAGMIDAFFLGIRLIPCPTLREPSGLALSSRNARLSETEKKIAPKLYETLTQVKDLETAKKILNESGFKVEYLVDKQEENKTRRYVAAWLGEVRLIDNVII